METKSAFCLLDIGPCVTTVTTSFANEAQTWQVVTPAAVTAAAVSTASLLLVEGSKAAACMSRFLSRIARFTLMAAVDHVILLTRHDTAPEVFTAYVLRWLRVVCPCTTAVRAMPVVLYAMQLAAVRSALVLEGQGGIVTCTPVLDGVVASGAAACWGDAVVCCSDEYASRTMCWRHAACAAMSAMAATAALEPGGSDDGDTSDDIFPLRLRKDAVATEVCVGKGALLHGLPFLDAGQQHVQRCRRQELGACLSTVVLYGEVATDVEARYCMGLVLSVLLPDSLVTWC